MPYELILLGRDADRRCPQLVQVLQSHVQAMQLSFAEVPAGTRPGDFDADVKLLHASPDLLQLIDWSAVPVAVWCGRLPAAGEQDDPDELPVVSELLRRGCPVFPVVDSLDNFPDKVPEPLWVLNGEIWPHVDALVANLLAAFGLTRRQRRAFISYRRLESQGVAVQLFDALNQRRYDAFLDTASIEGGVSFQEELHGRLANVDLVVLLHTATALNSNWVYEELNAAAQRGTEIVQVLWPGVDENDPASRHWEELGLTQPFPLQEADLVAPQSVQNQNPDAADSAMLASDCLQRLLTEIEKARIRSVKSRRDRIIRELLEAAATRHLVAVHYPAGRSGDLSVPHVTLARTSDQQPLARLLPGDGTPDSKELYRRFCLFAADDSLNQALDRSRLVFSDLGVLKEDLEHLQWLNSALQIKSLAAARAADWMGEL